MTRHPRMRTYPLHNPRTEALLDEQVSAAPEPLRSYIQELERQAEQDRRFACANIPRAWSAASSWPQRCGGMSKK